MKTAIQNFEYEGKLIEFDFGNQNIMVNATEMGKVFDKRIDFFLKSDHTKAFIEALKFPPNGVNLGSLTDEEIMITKGRSGTWMHRLLALKFASWLDPQFEVWVYFTIDKIMFGTMREDAKVKFDIQARKEELMNKFNEDPEYLELIKLQDLDKSTNKKVKKQQNAQFNIFLTAHSN